MKKRVIAMLLIAVMLAAVSATAFAATKVNTSVFIGSIIPDIVPPHEAEFEPEDGCQIVITSYGDRGTLPDGGAQMDAAAGAFGSTDFAAFGAKGNAKIAMFFDIHCTKYHTGHKVTITLTTEAAQYFVAALHYTGSWVNLNATVEDDKITFTTDSLSPFAILVSEEAIGKWNPRAPQTGETIGVAAAAASAVLFVGAGVLFVKGKKAED